ncbi:hypothetical protein LTR99_006563 [Exophiala xenobiotica]|uniref:SGNH hydrolase-type esterase domain-containing protein n=1 Tax=Vermiconidia calcicola TaxID=1690605 RepID=A0AAV9Q9T2_9PEZI|nr:hypothetical protein LTR72_008237 [Exophiala xenobiotica]KAK5537733.1 hypothetical protein LTR25_004985 [Vermiconidia calcicola]KAK5267376.1 hypothetical protein LTR96_007409 [Exophiala xenobiotica]KAK5291388.1 hypothetical protein LTR14_005962 [Exophiala xenobiotica]KAK5301596.1 hypothetical protein LTR99_006563 [Exophiala xenobiotica]
MSHSPSHSHSFTTTTPSYPKPYPQFLLFGDSITQGCSSHLSGPLSEWYIRRIDVLNRGFSGYTSQMGLDVLPHFFPAAPSTATTGTTSTSTSLGYAQGQGQCQQAQVSLMTVFFGANDAVLPGHPQHVPLHDYTRALRSIISYPPLALHGTKVILITPPPVDEWQLGNDERTATNTQTYAVACRQLGADLNLPTLDLWTIFMTKAGWREGDGSDDGSTPLIGSKAAPRSDVLDELLSDGLHFTPKAYQIVFEELVKLIQGKLPDHVPENLPFIFPDWKDKLGIEAQ